MTFPKCYEYILYRTWLYQKERSIAALGFAVASFGAMAAFYVAACLIAIEIWIGHRPSYFGIGAHYGVNAVMVAICGLHGLLWLQENTETRLSERFAHDTAYDTPVRRAGVIVYYVAGLGLLGLVSVFRPIS
jgi:hypothetical protein